jgi:hypothetical protein
MISDKSTHRLALFTDIGLQLQDLRQIESFAYYRVANDVGGFRMILKSDFDVSLIEPDHIIQFWRQAKGGEELHMMSGLCRKWGWFEDRNGEDKFFVDGVDQNDLIDRRIIAYAVGEDEADQTSFSDDLMKVIVRENMGDLAPVDEAGRPRAYDPNYFSVMAFVTEGVAVTRSFAWRYVLPVIQEIAQSSRDLGAPLFFDMVPSATPAVFEFQTFIPYLGVDRSMSSAVPVIFSKEMENLGSPRWEEDWFDERNYVYGGGQGEKNNRIIDPEDDVWRMHKSIWNRRECFQDAREEETQQGVANKAFERMQKERPVVRFDADLLDTPNTRFGTDWNYGDNITARYRGREFSGMVDGYSISVNEFGEEEFTARMEVEYGFGWQ